MCNVSGVISNLKGHFNDVPVTIGGHCLHETFFIGEEWNSHFDAILGQSFLQSHTCDSSWEGGDYIDMRLFPDGNRKGDAITV